MHSPANPIVDHARHLGQQGAFGLGSPTIVLVDASGSFYGYWRATVLDIAQRMRETRTPGALFIPATPLLGRPAHWIDLAMAPEPLDAILRAVGGPHNGPGLLELADDARQCLAMPRAQELLGPNPRSLILASDFYDERPRPSFGDSNNPSPFWSWLISMASIVSRPPVDFESPARDWADGLSALGARSACLPAPEFADICAVYAEAIALGEAIPHPAASASSSSGARRI